MREIKHLSADVLVVGGGSAGSMAAIQAGRLGLKVLLLERRESLGGYATNGYVHGVDGVITGLAAEFLERLRREDDVVPRSRFAMKNVVFDPEYGKLMLERMVVQAGVQILYGVDVVDCETVNNQITKVIAYNTSGRLEITARIYIDASGDADLAAAAGVPFETGAPDYAGFNQASTQVFRLSHVDLTKYNAANRAWQQKKAADPALAGKLSMVGTLYEQAVAEGKLPYFIWPTALFYPLPHTDDEDADVTCNSAHSIYCRSTDVEDRTRQIMEQHQQVVMLVKFLNEYVPGFEKAILSNITPMHGFRETRRIRGQYTLRDEDVAGGKKFEDAVARFGGTFDTHHPTNREIGFVRHIMVNGVEQGSTMVVQGPERESANMHPFARYDNLEGRVNPLNYCEIPFRCMISHEAQNLMVAGRCVSAGTHASAATRVIASCMATGQAAGVAARLCIDRGVMPAWLNGKDVRDVLITIGIPLDKPLEGFDEQKLMNTKRFSVDPAKDSAVALPNE